VLTVLNRRQRAVSLKGIIIRSPHKQPLNRFAYTNRIRTKGSKSTKSSGIHESKFISKAEPITEVVPYQPQHRFDDFALVKVLKENVAAHGYVTPTPIQDQAIPLALEGKDVIGVANTGTGKTAAFLLPLIDKICRTPNQKVLIIAPTRELADQIHQEFLAFTLGMGLRSALVIGGASMNNQIRDLRRNPHVVIGTPGRLLDHVNRRILNLGHIQNIVLDEADRMVDMGFINDIRRIISQVPTPRQSLFFTATFSNDVKSLIHSLMHDPVTVSVKVGETAATVDQDVIRFRDKYQKVELLHEHLNQEEFKKVLIFCRTKRNVEKLTRELVSRGFAAVEIHGNKTQSQRQKALQSFKDDVAKILVATDVAARGLDIPAVTHVINFDAPEHYEDYVHRIGRTGRAGLSGKALTFVS